MSTFWKKRYKKIGDSAGTLIDLDLGGVKATCPKCKNVYTGNEVFHRYYICPSCGAYKDYKQVSGQEFYISKLEASRKKDPAAQKEGMPE